MTAITPPKARKVAHLKSEFWLPVLFISTPASDIKYKLIAVKKKTQAVYRINDTFDEKKRDWKYLFSG